MIKVINPPNPGTSSDRLRDKQIATDHPFNHIVLFLDDEINYIPGDSVRSVPRVILIKKRAFGPAPFVGDIRYELGQYYWYFWIDDTGEHYVATEAELHILPREV